MSDPGTLRTVIESATALVVAWVAYHQKAIKNDVSRIELSINSRMDKLLQTTGELARATGISEEKERNKAELASNAAAVTESTKTKEP